MRFASLCTVAAIVATTAHGQSSRPSDLNVLPPSTTIPITFSRTLDANHAHVGDPVAARTTQVVKIADGRRICTGAQVIGHVTEVSPYAFNATPYAKQKESRLAIRFDTIADHGHTIPLSVYVRAMADPVTAREAMQPSSLDGTLTTFTQVGGDQRIQSQDEVLSRSGEVVAYQRAGGVVAHLLAGQGNSPDGCDSSDTEQAVHLFSASACGLYGFVDVSMESSGRGSSGSVVLQSRRLAPKIWANSEALLEVFSPSSDVASQ